MGSMMPVSSDSNRHHLYSCEDDACVRTHCLHRLWNEVCSTDRSYTQDLFVLPLIYIVFTILVLINISPSYLLLKKQPSTAVFFLYILNIDLIQNVMHNTYTHVYISNREPFHIYIYILYTPWAYRLTPKAIYFQLDIDTKGYFYLQVHPRGLH